MNAHSICFVIAWIVSAANAAAGQDLLERAIGGKSGKTSAEIELYANRDRLDLRAGARIEEAALFGKGGSARIGLGGTVEGDFACGRFDLRANLKGLVSKEAGEDFLKTLLGAVEGELAANALMLLAETSPTAFQLFQHFRVNANALLGINYNRCQAIETAVRDGLQSIRARAIKDCIDRKRAEGRTLEEALRACERSEEIRTMTGRRVKELDLAKDLKEALGISDVEFGNLERLLSKVRLRPTGAKGTIEAEPVLEEYKRLEKEFYEAWSGVTAKLAENPGTKIELETLKRLGPSWAARPLPVELQELSKIPAARRRILLQRIAREAALLELTARVQKLERWLAAAARHPAMDEALVRRREAEVRDLRRQLAHVAELARRREAYGAALLGLGALANGRQAGEAADVVLHARETETLRRYFEERPRWGELPGRSSPKRSARSARPPITVVAGRGCRSCGFGTVNKE